MRLYAKSPTGLFQKQQALVNICHTAHFDQNRNFKNEHFSNSVFACWGTPQTPFYGRNAN